MAENQFAQRHNWQLASLEADIKLESHGQWMAFLAAIVALVGGMVLLAIDRSIVGLATTIGAAAGIVCLQVWSRWQKAPAPPPPSALTEPKSHPHAPNLTESSRKRWPASDRTGRPPADVAWKTVRIGGMTIAGRRFLLGSLAWHPVLFGIRSETSLQGHQLPLREPLPPDHACLGSEIPSASGEDCSRAGAGTHGSQVFAPAAHLGQPARRRK